MRKVFFLVCLIIALPICVQAASDVIATYTYSDGSMVTLCTRDANHVRMDTSPTSYMLLSGNKVYTVNRDDDGTWQAVDMDQMKNSGVMSMFGGGSDVPDYDVRYEKTNKTEKIAGYDGTVYTAVIFEDGKVVERENIVLSRHGNIKKLTEGWMSMASRMSNMAKSFESSTEEAKKMGYGGILRYGNDMRLTNLKTKNLNPSYYALPSGVQQVQVRQQSGNDDTGLKDDAKDIGYDAKEATKDEIKGGIRDAISDIFN